MGCCPCPLLCWEIRNNASISSKQIYADVRSLFSIDTKKQKKGLFVPADFLDESFSDDLEGDIASECGKCGQIEKITVFSKNPRGVVIVKFNTSYASQECVKLMDGRFFGGKKLRCYFWDGSTNFTGLPCNGWLRMLLRLYYFILPTRFFQPFSPLFYSASDLTFL